MKRLSSYTLPVAMLAGAAVLSGQSAPPAQSGAPSKAAPAPPAAAKKAPPAKPPAAPAPMNNQDVIKLVKAKISEDVIIAKIKRSKTRFDVSVDGLVALKEAGVSDNVIAVMMDPAASAAPPPSAPASAASAPAPAPKPAFPPSNVPKEVAPIDAKTAPRAPAPKPVSVASAPANFGVYIWADGELKPLGRVQTKVQLSKFRSLLKSVVPFVRQKIDINIPGAHSTSRYDLVRPTFFAFFPASRDVSKFKLLQAKITGQRFDQRTLANASIMFSTEQNQDEVPCDIGPTAVKDLYRIFPREDIPSGEFGFVEGNTGSKSTSNIEILDVYDFAIDRKEDKMGLKDYLQTLPAANAGEAAFLNWPKEDCVKIVADRTGKVGLTGSLMGCCCRQASGLRGGLRRVVESDLRPDEQPRAAATGRRIGTHLRGKAESEPGV